MKATNHVYVSDLFTVPMPKHAASPEEFRRKVLIRRLVWATLPYVLEGCLFLLAAGLIIGGLLTLFCGLR